MWRLIKSNVVVIGSVYSKCNKKNSTSLPRVLCKVLPELRMFHVLRYLTADLQLSGHEKLGWRPEGYSATHSKNCIFIAKKKLRTFGLGVSIYLLCQVKNPDEINTRYVFLLEKIKTSLEFALISCFRSDILQLEFIGKTYPQFGCPV